jgi:hypothetical protein
MRITALVPTHHLPGESLAWITDARNIFDEVIVLIDQKRATPGTVSRAEKVASRVVLNNRDTWYDPDRFSLLDGCNSDWVFLLEYDEQLSPEWQQAGWRQLLETTNFTHFWILRRWTVPGGRYICDNPWWPDFQLRLFRNNLEGTTFPAKLHDRISIPGPGAGFRSLMIYHHVLTLWSRAEREKRVLLYEEMRPGGGGGHYYVYEKYRPSEAPLPAAEIVDLEREVIRMDALSEDDSSRISIELGAVVREVSVAEMFWLDVEVTNATNGPLYSCPPFPVHLSYHWIQSTPQRMVVFDGERSGLFPCARAGATTPWKMVVIAPGEPGEYILQVSVVQDGIRWFENVDSTILREFLISVTARK